MRQTEFSTNSSLAGGTSGVAVVILNYMGRRDTVACLQSLLRSHLPPDWIIVIDNASPDDSSRHILQAMRDFQTPFGRRLQELAADNPDAVKAFFTHNAEACAESGLFFIQSGVNGGYAAGNNLGIHLALLLGAEAVWVLNNDITVAPDALRAMRDRLFSSARPGLCGSLIRYADAPDMVQCLGGGHTNRWTGLSTLCGHRLFFDDAMAIPPEKVESHLNFIYGASVMASRSFIETVGPLDERFFMYCEEQDWAYRAAGRFDFVYARDAHVWHKEGASTGWPRRLGNFTAIRRLVRSRLQLARKHCPATLPTVLLGLVYAMFRLLYRRCCAEPRLLSHIARHSSPLRGNGAEASSASGRPPHHDGKE